MGRTCHDGTLLVSKGQEVTPSLCHRLKNFSKNKRIKEPIRSRRQLLDVGAAGPIAGFVAGALASWAVWASLAPCPSCVCADYSETVVSARLRNAILAVPTPGSPVMTVWFGELRLAT